MCWSNFDLLWTRHIATMHAHGFRDPSVYRCHAWSYSRARLGPAGWSLSQAKARGWLYSMRESASRSRVRDVRCIK